MINIYNKDCLEAMKEMSDNQFDLAIVDPPYGIDIAKWDAIEMRPNKKYWDELKRNSSQYQSYPIYLLKWHMRYYVL